MNSQNKRMCKLFAGQAAGWIAFALVILPMFRLAYKGERAVVMMSLFFTRDPTPVAQRKGCRDLPRPLPLLSRLQAFTFLGKTCAISKGKG